MPSNNEKTTAAKRRRVAANSAVERRRNVNRSSETSQSNQERVATRNGFDSEDQSPAAKRRRVDTTNFVKGSRVVSGSENLSSNERITRKNKIDLEEKEQSFNQTLVPAAKRRRVVTRSSEMKLSNEKRRRIDTWSSEPLPSNKEVLPLSNDMVNGEDASLINFSELSKSIPEDFETYKRLFLKWKTTIVKENVLSKSICNCPAFGTEYICKHIIGLAIRLKLVTPPPEAKTIPIGEKRKPGRPSKTKPALMIQ